MHLMKSTKHEAAEGRQDLAAACGKIAASCACFNLRKAARVATQLYDEALAPVGLGAAQFSLLVALELMQPVAVTRLARAMAMDRTTLTRNLRPLERDGLVRIAAGEDRRTRSVVLTERGQDILARAIPLWRSAQGRVTRHLGGPRVTRLLGDLDGVLALRPS